ncbi:MAG: DUF2520 domain-containing protein [Bacteroidota bacterium]
MPLPKIAFIGAGNLAWHLAPALHGQLAEVVLVLGRQSTPYFNWPLAYSSDWEALPAELDAYFLAVPDQAIRPVSQRLRNLLPPTAPLIHVSGSTPVDHIDLYFRRSGAFWPIQSMRKGQELVDFSQVGIGYYSPDQPLEQLLRSWAAGLSQRAYRMDDQQRAQLHLASVMGNNFGNFFRHLAFRFSQEANLPFSLLHQLLEFPPLEDTDPFDQQTGPASRFDQATLIKHLELLQEQPELRDLYLEISKMIAGTQREVSK